MTHRCLPISCRSQLLCLGASLALAVSSHASSRRFSYNYETTTMAKGAVELESWVTWKSNMDADPDFERFDFRHEIEYGVSDRFQLALYFADWRYEKNADDSGDAGFRDVALEAIYNLTDPNTTPFGSALYGEIKGSDDFVELEAKLLLQKNLGHWMFVYNVGGEIAWENRYEDDEAELLQSARVSYEITPSWSVGAEVLHEIAAPDVATLGDSAVYAGPNVAWRNDRFAVAVTGMWQLTALSDEPDFQLRTIFSIDFLMSVMPIRVVAAAAIASVAIALLPVSCDPGYQTPPVTAALVAASPAPAAQLQRGYQVHQQHCAKCHMFQNPAAYPPSRLARDIMPVMARKSNLNPDDAQAVLVYLLAARQLPPAAP